MIPKKPTEARLVINTVPAGSIFAEEPRSPASVIFVALSSKARHGFRVMSVGVYQAISPSFQNAGFSVFGVPPPTVSQTSSKVRCSQPSRRPSVR